MFCILNNKEGQKQSVQITRTFYLIKYTTIYNMYKISYEQMLQKTTTAPSHFEAAGVHTRHLEKKQQNTTIQF